MFASTKYRNKCFSKVSSDVQSKLGRSSRRGTLAYWYCNSWTWLNKNTMKTQWWWTTHKRSQDCWRSSLHFLGCPSVSTFLSWCFNFVLGKCSPCNKWLTVLVILLFWFMHSSIRGISAKEESLTRKRILKTKHRRMHWLILEQSAAMMGQERVE
jgi:hypothetical protein